LGGGGGLRREEKTKEKKRPGAKCDGRETIKEKERAFRGEKRRFVAPVGGADLPVTKRGRLSERGGLTKGSSPPCCTSVKKKQGWRGIKAYELKKGVSIERWKENCLGGKVFNIEVKRYGKNAGRKRYGRTE